MKKILLLLLLCLVSINTVYAGDFLTPILEKAKREKKAVMIELGSKTCIPCRNMVPVMEKLKSNYGKKLEVVFVDVREYPDIAKKYNVYVIPVQVFLDANGREFHRHIGYYPYEEIVEVLKKNRI